jgi:hypothetical protein
MTPRHSAGLENDHPLILARLNDRAALGRFKA